ncbi:acyl-CoA N-acyltransferase [Rickenella mellea]|uniref:Acyl-CoA N-acyltransferase n=1 Tax=Rickenella mellea TaxID=50990 RepID=A0A4Y7Q3Z4_9AGAM|nr:acyl-CoA N-acyltransferase [Rickenella mellea]
MKVNEHIAIRYDAIVLVPYRPEHVETYHQWMSDPELRELTASEPLTLEEEYGMQRKWQLDEDKLTFIILCRENTSSGSETSHSTVEDVKNYPMIGDVNLFFKGSRLDDDFEVEVEIMIAESDYRRRGIASQALQMIMSFATTFSSPPLLPVRLNHFVVRIGSKNVASINMFEKLGFAVTKHVAVFDEVEMRLKDGGEKVSEKWITGDIVDYP